MTPWWSEPLDAVVSDGFTYVGPAALAGSYDKHFLTSKKNGKTYLWKSGKRKLGMVSTITGKPRAAKSRDKEFTQPNAEYFASKAAQGVLAPGEHIPVAKLPFPIDNVEGVVKGTLGIVMPFVDQAEANTFRDDFSDNLTPDDIRAIQRLHVFDYLVSNMDTHSETTLRVGGKLIGIDRGQAMRYMSQIIRATLPKLQPDTLDRTTTPVGAKSYYDEFFRKVKEGKIEAPFTNIADILEKVQNISDDTWREWMADYLEAFKNKYLVAMKSQVVGKPGNKTYWKGLTPEEIDRDIQGVADGMVRRKNTIRRDVIKFYKKLRETLTEMHVKKFGVSRESLLESVESVVDTLVSQVFLEVDEAWTSDIQYAEDAEAAYHAALKSHNQTKALYFQSLESCLNSLVRGEHVTSEGMMKQVVKVASRWKQEATEIITDLTPKNLEAAEYAYASEVNQGMIDAYAQDEMSWVIFYMSLYNIKLDGGKITGALV